MSQSEKFLLEDSTVDGSLIILKNSQWLSQEFALARE
jgi:hypothetical protein